MLNRLKILFDEVTQIVDKYFIVKQGNNYGVLNATCAEILPLKYEKIKYDYSDNLFIIKEYAGQYNDTCYLWNITEGKVSEDYVDIVPTGCNSYVVEKYMSEHGKYFQGVETRFGVITRHYELLPFIYKSIVPYGQQTGKVVYACVTIKNGYVLLDDTGDQIGVFSSLSELNDFAENY
jgi:hypothetical protein